MGLHPYRQGERTDDFYERFCRSLRAGLQLAELFEHLPDVYLFIKDRRSRFLRANTPLLELLGLESNDAIVGRSDRDFFSRDLVEQYVQEDTQVMDSGRPILNQAQIVPRGDGVIHWYVTSKLPLWGDEDRIVGLAGVMRDYENIESLHRPSREIRQTVSYILGHYSERISCEELADLAHLSKSQFNRRFRIAFGMSPQQFIARVRIKAARHLLAETDLSLTVIAQRTGFYDHSYFTKKFKTATGLSPLAYRKMHAEDDAEDPRRATREDDDPSVESPLQAENAQGWRRRA